MDTSSHVDVAVECELSSPAVAPLRRRGYSSAMSTAAVCAGWVRTKDEVFHTGRTVLESRLRNFEVKHKG